MFVHNASDWVTMRNISVSANYENQLTWTNKVVEENDKLTQRRHSKPTKWHLFLNSNNQLAEESSLYESIVVQLNSTAYNMGHNNHLGGVLIHSTQTMSICQLALYQRSLANEIPRKELYESILRLLRIPASMTAR